MGRAFSFEADIFNVPSDKDVSPDVTLNVAYEYALTRDWALGVHLYGYTMKFNYFVGDLSGNVRQAEFALNSYNTGLKGKYYVLHRRVEPYLFANLNSVSGQAEDKDLGGKLKIKGFSVGGGFGALLRVGGYFGLSLEGIANVGGADWEAKPFLNSTGTEFNPSFLGILLNLQMTWGE